MAVDIYDPFSDQAMSDPFELYRALRDHAPVQWLPKYDTWVLSRFADVWEALQDRGDLSVVEGPVFERDRLLVHNDGAPAGPPARPVRSFATLDPPAHTALRQLMVPTFTPRACGELAGEVDRLVVEQLDRLSGRDRFDVVADYAGPVATAATLRFLGLPVEVSARVQGLINTATRRDAGTPGASSPAALAAHAELHQLLVDHVHARRAAA